MERSNIWIIKFRDFSIKDLKLGVRAKDTAKSALRFFEEGGYIIPLHPEWEWLFLCSLVESHPINKRDFEHFLTESCTNIMPSQIRKDLETRSERIPTLAVVRLEKPESADMTEWKVENIMKVMDANDLYDLKKEMEAV